ncbi:MAG: MFS transporter [Sphingobacteriales bacterium UTBCD1]|jgi:EmrB/QacA subfamily drug resistance transporter|nr:MAG: MFS transporter [Sphingobacteriales bacterium UTBCD1]
MLLKRNWILAALMLTMALAAMDTTIVSTAIPQIVSDLGGFSKFSWVFSIYLLTQTASIPIYGKLADIFGRKVILILGIIIFLAGSAASAISWNILSLIIFRGIQGFGAGSIMATVNTIAGDIYTVKERAKIQGLLSSIWGISAIVGPALGGALAEYVSWRWIFIINIPIGIISIIFLAVFFNEIIIPKKPKIDYNGAVHIMLTLGLLIVYLLESGVSWPWLSPASFGMLAVIVFLAINTYRIEKRVPDPIFPSWLWKNKTFAYIGLAMVGMGIVNMGPDTFLPTFTQASLGLGIIASGFVLASMSIGWPAASSLSGIIYLRIGFRNTALIGTIVLTFSCIAFLLIPWPQPVWMVVADQVILGAGFGLLSTPTLVGVQSMVEWEKRGVATGSVVFTRNLGSSLGAAIFGAIFNNSLSAQMASAPKDLSVDTSQILRSLESPSISAGSKIFLEKAINTATHHIYYSLVLFSLLTLVCMLFVPNDGKPDEKKINKIN